MGWGKIIIIAALSAAPTAGLAASVENENSPSYRASLQERGAEEADRDWERAQRSADPLATMRFALACRKLHLLDRQSSRLTDHAACEARGWWDGGADSEDELIGYANRISEIVR